MADDADKLLRHIARRVLARESALEIERDSTAANDGAEIAADQRRVMRDEEQRAEDLSGPFRDGLRRADAARRAGGDAISLDDRKQEDNLQADALIHFLVRADLATSRARETDQHRYIYTISIDWEALTRVAREARVDLDSVLSP
ncbi:MAG TPA: hypothetical protein VMM78_02840 [Thermomicrobiales bacterium]|nr:hypothetical protein [Thermomicrobiales bacterium]